MLYYYSKKYKNNIMKKALISVFNKEKLIDFINPFTKEFQFLSTGGTYSYLQKNNIATTSIEKYTESKDFFNERVKSLHPKIYAGILSLERQNNNIDIDMVIVNFYPFIEKTEKSLDLQEMLNFIDIGGPSLLRAAAKNYPSVVAVCDINDYDWIVKEWQQTKKISLESRKKLAAKVFSYCAKLDNVISHYLLPKNQLRYGENPHQKAYLRKTEKNGLGELKKLSGKKLSGKKLSGKELSYNNYLDIGAALDTLKGFSIEKPHTVIIKHNNPCGIASGNTLKESLKMAWSADDISAFGSIIACNSPLDLDFASFLVSPEKEHFQKVWEAEKYIKKTIKKKFFEVLIAPSFKKDALDLLEKFSKNSILLEYKNLKETNWRKQSFWGICLEQEKDCKADIFQQVTTKNFSPAMQKLAKFGVSCCKHLKSNAIAIVREYQPNNYQLISAGSGQPNRIDAFVKLAIPKLLENLKEEFEEKNKKIDFLDYCKQEKEKMILISDAFFPFDDVVKAAHFYGIMHIVQPGGSKNDKASIDFCNKNKMAMLFNGLRHFLH